MVRSDLIQALSKEYSSVRHPDIVDAVSIFFELIVGQLEAGGTVELRRFGRFFVRDHVALQRQNPKTGVAYSKAQRKLPRFKPAGGLAALIKTAGPAALCPASASLKALSLSKENA